MLVIRQGARGWAMPDPIVACGRSHSRRWRTRNIAKRPGGGYGEAQWPIGPRTTGRRIAPLPGRTPLDNWSSLRVPGGWARLTAGSGRVSGAVAHVSKRELGTRRRGESGSSTGRQVRETRGPPSYAAGRSTDISSLVNMPT